jgi:hypothetical protein
MRPGRAVERARSVRRRILDGHRHLWRATADGADLDHRKRTLHLHDRRLDSHHAH